MNFSGIKIIKLLNGQEVIGEILDEQDIENWVEIKEPRLINFDVDQDGNLKVGLGPFSIFTEDKTFILNSTCILSIFSSALNLTNAYRQQISGIVLANEGQLKQLELLEKN
jgi:hypothetical protein